MALLFITNVGMNSELQQKRCLKCKKHFHKAPMIGCCASTVEVDDIILKKNELFRKLEGEVIKDSDDQLEIHKACYT